MPTMSVRPEPRPESLFEPLERRVLLAIDGVHAIAIEFDPDQGLMFAAASAETVGPGGQNLSFADSLAFTYDTGGQGDEITALSFQGPPGAYDFGITFEAGDRFAERTSAGFIDGRPGFSFARTPGTGAWNLMILATFEDQPDPDVTGSYAANIVIPDMFLNELDLIIGAGTNAISAGAFDADYQSNDDNLNVSGISDAIDAVLSSGKIELASGAALYVAQAARAMFGAGLADIEGSLTYAVRRDPDAPALTAPMLEGATYAVAMFGNDSFFDPQNANDGLEFGADRASIRFRKGGQVERFDIDPEFVAFNPDPVELGSFTVLTDHMIQITWQGPAGASVVSRFEVAGDARTLVPIRTTLGQQTSYAFGIGVRAVEGAALPPIDIAPPPPVDNPDDPNDPSGGDDGDTDGNGSGGADGGGDNDPGGPVDPGPDLVSLENMESVTGAYDPITGHTTLFVELMSDGESPPRFSFIDLDAALGTSLLSEPALTLTGDGSTIIGVGLTSNGLISFASRPDRTFISEAALDGAMLDAMESYAPTIRSTLGGVVNTNARFANSNRWIIALTRTPTGRVDILQALGDVDQDGIIEFERTTVSDVAIAPDGEAGAPTGPSSLMFAPWGTVAYFYTDAEGDIWSFWKHRDAGTWYANNISLAAGATPAGTGAIAAAGSKWGSIHIAFTDTEGHLRQLWWEWHRNTWVEDDTGSRLDDPDINPATLAIGFDDQSVTITGVESDSSRLVHFTWDVTSDSWRPLQLGDALGVVPQPRADLSYQRTVSGRIDLVGNIIVSDKLAIAAIAGPTFTFDTTPAATLTFDYVVTPLLANITKNVRLEATDLAILEPYELTL